ncbi:putative alpha beta [Diaporthe ampelina]|uniref:Putative alpha beta n=1 Tax=Diaporthe ampelina TaxID=1214573 RepID=A0A0G2FB55_9PEZI|nr:putative alpha beta [Diaporthe ampelina]
MLTVIASHQWTTLSPAASERNVLKYVPYLREAISDTASPQGAISKPDPYGPRVWRSTMVALSGKNRLLNEYSVERIDESPDETLVMLHGYGAGLGFFYQNFEPLTRVKGWRLYALDMLGMGNSSRPAFRIKAKDSAEKIQEAEGFFVDALEEWRKIRKIEKFTLLGHSLGGYLATAYALKYPGHLNKLILASPVGVPDDPNATSAELPEPQDSTLAQEFTQSQESIVQQESNTKTTDVRVGNNKTKQVPKAPRRQLPGWLVWLWDTNAFSPFSFVRLGGPLGPRFVSGWTSRRFNHLPPEEATALHEYSYNLFRQKGSGEFALTYILAPGAYARNPLINRIDEVGRQVLKSASDGQPAKRETGFPIVLMYGDGDWMDVQGGFAAEEKIKARVEKALMEGTEEERRDENGSARTIVVRKAGHHLYLDNPDEFNKYITKELEETRDYNRRRKAQGLSV